MAACEKGREYPAAERVMLEFDRWAPCRDRMLLGAKGIASSNKCLTSKALVTTSEALVFTSKDIY